MSLTTRTGKGSQLTQAEMDANLAEIGAWSTDVASAATCDLSTATGNIVNITGNVTITSFGSAAPKGTMRWLTFSGAPQITHNSSTLNMLMVTAGYNYVMSSSEFMLVIKTAAAGVDGWKVIAIWGWSSGRIANTLQSPIVFNNGSLSGAVTLDPMAGTYQRVTLNGNATTFTISAPKGSMPMTLVLDIYQDATGSRTWPAGGPASSKWWSGATKTLSTAANSRDQIVAFYDGANWIVQQFLKAIA